MCDLQNPKVPNQACNSFLSEGAGMLCISSNVDSDTVFRPPIHQEPKNVTS